MKIKSGSYAGKLVSEVPLDYLLWYFSRCKDLEFKELIKERLLKTNDSKIIEKVYKKELENLLFDPYQRRKMKEEARKEEYKNKVSYLLKQIQNSPNFQGVKLDIKTMTNQIVHSTFKKAKVKK